MGSLVGDHSGWSYCARWMFSWATFPGFAGQQYRFSCRYTVRARDGAVSSSLHLGWFHWLLESLDRLVTGAEGPPQHGSKAIWAETCPLAFPSTYRLLFLPAASHPLQQHLTFSFHKCTPSQTPLPQVGRSCNSQSSSY